MIKVFNGNWRGPGGQEKRKGMILEFAFRKMIKHFRGAKLAVFMAIALHSDERGIAWPSYDLLEDETGYTRGAIGRALKELCNMKIDDHPVLAKLRERDDKGQFTGSNIYLIFPTPEEVQSIEKLLWDAQSIKNPPLDNSNGGENELEVKPLIKDKPEESSKTKTPYVQAMEKLESTFAEARGCPLPDWDSDPKAANKRWRTPLKKIWEKCDKDTEATVAVVHNVTSQMRNSKLTFDAPDQILKTAFSYIIDNKNGKQPSTYPVPDGI